MLRYKLRSLLIVLALGPPVLAGCGQPELGKARDMNAKPSWAFDQARNAAAITTRQVLEGSPILNVVHYEDDHSWAFTCGTTDDETDGRVISMDQAVNLDSTVKEVADLPPGWKAWRTAVGDKWQRSTID